MLPDNSSILSILPSTTDDSLLDALSSADLYRYGRTCKSMHSIVQLYISRTFQLRRVLSRYFTQDEIEHFRWLQVTTGMLISGSTALQFFNRVVYPESDLDVYVAHAYRELIGLWLLEIGYKYVPRTTTGPRKFEDDLIRQPRSPGMNHTHELIEVGQGYLGSECVFTFVKMEPYRKVQMITSKNSPLERILNFHSTCVMNMITHDTAYALFPRGTFEERRALSCVDVTEHTAIALAKYEERGWSIGANITRDEFDNPKFAFARGRRYVGDAQCWKLPIFPKIDQSPLYDIESNSWQIKYDTDLNLTIKYNIVKSHRLVTSYLIDQDDGHLQRHIHAEFNEFELADSEEAEDSEYFLDAEFTGLIDWFRDGHDAADSCNFYHIMG